MDTGSLSGSAKFTKPRLPYSSIVQIVHERLTELLGTGTGYRFTVSENSVSATFLVTKAADEIGQIVVYQDSTTKFLPRGWVSIGHPGPYQASTDKDEELMKEFGEIRRLITGELTAVEQRLDSDLVSSHAPLGSAPIDPKQRNWEFELEWLRLWTGNAYKVAAAFDYLSTRIGNYAPLVAVALRHSEPDRREYELVSGDDRVIFTIIRHRDRVTIQLAPVQSRPETPGGDAIHNYLSGQLWFAFREYEEQTKPARPTDRTAGAAQPGPNQPNGRIVRDDTRKRAETFRRIKDANPELSRAAVAMRAHLEDYPDATEEDVRNDYRAMGWPWPRGDKAR